MDSITHNGMYTAGGRLGQKVALALSHAPGMQLSLTEEVAIARATVEDLMELYNKASVNAGGELDMVTCVVMGTKIREALKSVSVLVDRAFKIEQGRVIQPAMVAALATHLQNTCTSLLGHNPTLLNQFESSLHNAFDGIINRSVGLNDNTGVASPGQICDAMDETVPVWVDAEGEPDTVDTEQEGRNQ